ncbi:MAG: sigma-54-dependent Fis family transcriptional regulator [Chitinophagaceae bacterium]|nr:sigma-54-dependent Fis family transcriptional regulator [Oligoflexus sp.]
MVASLNILIIDDELNIRRTLALALEAEGYTVKAVSNVQDAERENNVFKFDMCFLDMRLGTDNGIDLLPKLLEKSPWLKVVVITAYASINNAVEAMRRGAFDYIQKPFTSAQIYAVAQKVVTILSLERKVQDLEAELAKNNPEMEVQSCSLIMQKLISVARSVAPTDATVLITGENGTGKSVLAKAIHMWSLRKKKPFAVVSCPSLSGELLESELFGHNKGAFTGAIRNNPGRIEACEGGTLFLDEIGDLPMPLQAKLLRFLQDREYEHVGDNTTRRADVRVVAATNVKLKDAVKEGRFREDLFYRLNVIELGMPSLRERSEDIELLAEKCLIELRRDKRISGFSEGAMNLLRTYKWPGNIRELRNIIERAVILCRTEIVETSDLNIEDTTAALSKTKETVKFETLEKIEEQQIRKVLAASRSMDQAAQYLGIDTVTLWRKRKRYGL